MAALLESAMRQLGAAWQGWYSTFASDLATDARANQRVMLGGQIFAQRA